VRKFAIAMLLFMPVLMGSGHFNAPREQLLFFGMNQTSTTDQCLRATSNTNGNDNACDDELTLHVLPYDGKQPTIVNMQCMFSLGGTTAAAEYMTITPEFRFSNSTGGDGTAFDTAQVATAAAVTVTFVGATATQGDWVNSGPVSVQSTYGGEGPQFLQLRIDHDVTLATPATACAVKVRW
jgi:hypothetical protein